MDMRGLCGHKSESSCSHGGCTKQLPEHCSSLFVLLSGIIAGPPEQRWLRPIDAGNRDELLATSRDRNVIGGSCPHTRPEALCGLPR
jgi:hypothetical protein